MMFLTIMNQTASVLRTYRTVLTAQEARDAGDRIAETIGKLLPKIQDRVLANKSLTKRQAGLHDAACEGAWSGAVFGALLAR